MTRQALATLLWSSTVSRDDGDDLVPADAYNASAGLIEFISNELDQFIEQLPDDFEPEDHWIGCSSEPGWDAWDQLAHDYILTRNHHGAGFWDGEWAEPAASMLTKLAHQKTEIEVYLNDNDEIEAL